MDRFDLNAAFHGKVACNWRIDTARKHQHSLSTGAHWQPSGSLDRFIRQISAIDPYFYTQIDVWFFHLDFDIRKTVDHRIP